MTLYQIIDEYIEYNLSNFQIKKYTYSYTHQTDLQTLYKHFKKQYSLVDIDITKFNTILNYTCSEKIRNMETMGE